MLKPIVTQEDLKKIDFLKIKENPFWNETTEKEVRIHKIHVYPAKFPSLIAQKAFEYAEKNNVPLETVADIFCGCGTVAVEAKRRGIKFWGCDINPVAVMISKAKTSNYDIQKVKALGDVIIDRFVNKEFSVCYDNANERLKYWFYEAQYKDLAKLKNAIETETIDDEYRNLFICLFSSILKASSKWLAKSIKPQVDPDKHVAEGKKPADVLGLFKKQLEIVIKAISEVSYNNRLKPNIKTCDVLEVTKKAFADIIVTSPPYVTSYEYADLHQLSALWLGYANHYADLRKGSIGSVYGTNTIENPDLLPTARKIVNYFKDGSQARAITRYYSDMREFVSKSYSILKQVGVAVFVIGDTEYKKNYIENARCLCESMIDCGYTIVEISKRKVQNKFLPSHRDENGKFSSNKTDRAIYSQEYIIIGRKN